MAKHKRVLSTIHLRSLKTEGADLNMALFKATPNKFSEFVLKGPWEIKPDKPKPNQSTQNNQPKQFLLL